MCDLACKTKIIIDGDRAATSIQATTNGLLFFFNQGGALTDKQALNLHEQLIAIENQADNFARAVCNEIGYKGPLPQALALKV